MKPMRISEELSFADTRAAISGTPVRVYYCNDDKPVPTHSHFRFIPNVVSEKGARGSFNATGMAYPPTGVEGAGIQVDVRIFVAPKDVDGVTTYGEIVEK